MTGAGDKSKLCDVVCPGEVMVEGEASTFQRLNLFHWLTMEIDRWVHLAIIPEEQAITVRFAMI